MSTFRAKIFESKDGDRFLVPGYWHEVSNDWEEPGRSSFDAFMFAVICDCKVAPGWLVAEARADGRADIPNQPYNLTGRQFAHGYVPVLLIAGPCFEECWKTDHPDEPVPVAPLTDEEIKGQAAVGAGDTRLNEAAA